MHALVMSKEQTRKVKDFLAIKNIEFPTTNDLLPVRKSLRPNTFSVLDGKGRSLDYKNLVSDTISLVLRVVPEPREMKEGSLKMYLKDGGDGAGTMPVLKSKGAAVDQDHIFQYGSIPLKLYQALTNHCLHDIVCAPFLFLPSSMNGEFFSFPNMLSCLIVYSMLGICLDFYCPHLFS